MGDGSNPDLHLHAGSTVWHIECQGCPWICNGKDSSFGTWTRKFQRPQSNLVHRLGHTLPATSLEIPGEGTWSSPSFGERASKLVLFCIQVFWRQPLPSHNRWGLETAHCFDWSADADFGMHLLLTDQLGRVCKVDLLFFLDSWFLMQSNIYPLVPEFVVSMGLWKF